MPAETITSRSNPTIKLARSLITRRVTRYRERRFVAEGLNTIETLLNAGMRPETLLFDARRATSSINALTAKSDDLGARILPVSPSLLTQISDTDTPQAVIAIFQMPEHALPDQASTVVILDGVADPGNAGTILRSSVAFGAELVVFLRGSVDPYNPKVVRSSAGLIGKVPVVHYDDLQGLLEDLPVPLRSVYVTDPHGGEYVDEVTWQHPAGIILGSEASGPSPDSIAHATSRVRIRMTSAAESLNVAVAASIVLYEVFQSAQRRSN